MGTKSKEDLGEVNPNFEGENGIKSKKYEASQNVVCETQEEGGQDRDQWDRPIEFLLSCVAMSVGLGNVWRFPFTAYDNGGGAFLIPYLIILIFVGKPLYYMELVLGQFSSYGCVGVWDIVPAFRGIGYGQALGSWCVVTYYVSLMALTVFYFFSSFQTVLPWSTCPEDALSCVDANTNMSEINFNESITSSELYFEKQVLFRHPNGLDDGIFAPEWRLSLCLLFAWLVIFLILIKGVKSSGKASYFTALFPYVVLFILLGRGVTLPGALKGIMFFIKPRWEELLNPKVWYAAVSQSFFSLSVGFGSIIMFSSYNNFRHNVYRDATIISVVDTLTSLLAGLTIFAILGHLAEIMGIDDIKDILKGGGSSLAFISYPDVLSRFNLPVVPQLFSVLFFLMLFTLGAGSATALVGCVITVICDNFPSVKRQYITFAVCIVGFGLGLFYVTPQGQYLLELVDFYGGTVIIYILTFLEVIAVQWIYGYSRFIKDIEFMLHRKTGWYWAFCWVFFIPILLVVIFCYRFFYNTKPLKSGDYVFGQGANGFGIFIIILAVGAIVACFLNLILRKKRSLKECFQAKENWCPKDPIFRKQYQEFLQEERGMVSQLGGIDNPAVLGGVAIDRKVPALNSYKYTE